MARPLYLGSRNYKNYHFISINYSLFDHICGSKLGKMKTSLRILFLFVALATAQKCEYATFSCIIYCLMPIPKYLVSVANANYWIHKLSLATKYDVMQRSNPTRNIKICLLIFQIATRMPAVSYDDI